ncbi:MAG: hypothetical protein JWP91_89 [Fibrobacteres bacterium]|nr:hypothetical protein [Fibrobacterota bacterium]
MRLSARAILVYSLIGIVESIPADPSLPSTKEFRTGDGLVKITLVPESKGEEGAEVGVEARPINLDSATDIAALVSQEGASNPLLEVYFQDGLSGEELRFPAKVSQLRDFLRQHPGEFGTGSADERAVAMVRTLSHDLRVRMKTPGSGGGK